MAKNVKRSDARATVHTCSVSDVLRAVETIAPPRLAESWDSVGLQVGHPGRAVKRAMTCLELTPATLAEAAAGKADVVIAHHPLIFKPLAALSLAQPAGQLIAGLIRADIALIAAHTNLDAGPWGTNTVLAEACGLDLDLTNIEPLAPKREERFYKFVVFVPAGHEQAIIDAIERGGGGSIGAYKRCTFRAPGIGTFQGGAHTKPFIGDAGAFTQTDELRLETIVSEDARTSVLREVKAAHPYEEMAYDLYELADPKPKAGLGLVAKLNSPLTFAAAAANVSQALKPAMVRLSGPEEKKIKRVAICTGSGGSFIGMAAARAELLLTGEINYHQAMEAKQRGLAVIEVGHYESEALIAQPLAIRLAAAQCLRNAGVEVFATATHEVPFRYSGRQQN